MSVRGFRAAVTFGVATITLLAVSVRAAVAAEDVLLKSALDSGAGVVERTRAFAELRAVASESSIPALAKLLDDPAWSFSARSVLEVMPGIAADRALLAALESARTPALRAGLINSLGNRKFAGAVPVIARFLSSPDVPVADTALNALGNIASVAAGEVLAGFRPPAALRRAWADALVRAADGVASSDRRKSLEFYRLVAANPQEPAAGAATIGLARQSDKPVPVILDALKSAAPAPRIAALALIRSGEFGRELTDAVGAVVAALPPDLQVQVLSVLYDRGDRAAAPIARRALSSADPLVRGAAAKLLSVVGEPSDAPALLGLMIGTEEPAPSARLALSRIPGEATTSLLLGAFRSGGEARAAALDVLVSRGHRAMVPALLQPEVYADEEFGHLAANAVLVLGTGDDLTRVLELYRNLPVNRRGLLENAVRRLASKHTSPDDAARIVFAAAEKLPLGDARPLHVTLAGIGGDTALTSVVGLLKSESVEKRKAALRALGNWRDLRAVEPLLAAARDDANASVRALAVQSATTVLAKGAASADGSASAAKMDGAIAGLRLVWAVAAQPEEKSTVLAALRGLKVPKAIAAAEELERSLQR